jgi:hypothetical protein
MRKLLFTFLIFLQFSALKAQTLIRDQQVATFNSYASSWTSDLSDFTFKVDGQGNDYIKYYNPGANYPWNGMPYWVIPDLNTAVYALGIAPWWTNEPDVLYNSVDLDFDVDSIGNKYYVFNTTPYDSASANGIMFYGGVWTFSLNTNNTLRWAKEGIGVVLPDNAGNSFYIKNDTVCKLDANGNKVLAIKVSNGVSLIAADQLGGAYIKENGQIKRINSQGVISWARNYFDCVSDPKGNLYLQVNADSALKVDRYNNEVWKRKRNVLGQTFDYSGNSYAFSNSGNGALMKYNSLGTVIWQYCHIGSTSLGLGIAANNRPHVFAGALDGEYNYYKSSLASFTDNISAYYVQEYSSTITTYSINVLPNEVVQQYYTYGVSELCQCSPTNVPFSTECKQFNTGNIFSLWICDNTGTNCIKIADMSGTSNGTFTNVGLPSIRPGNFLKITSTSPAVSSSLFYYPIIEGYNTEVKLSYSPTPTLCDSVLLKVLPFDCYGNYYSFLKKNGVVIDSLYNTSVYYVKSSGNYSISLKAIGVNCPKESDTLSITVSQPASSSVSIVGSSTVCTGQTVNLKATVNTPMFRWERNGLYIPGSDNQQNYYASQTGFYRVYAYDSLGCNKYSAAKKATVGIGVVSISTNGSTTFCNGDSVGFGVDQLTGYTYQWKKNGVNIAGATAPMYYAKSAGIYRCMFTNASGCTKTSNSYYVNVNCRVADGGNDNDLVVYPNPAEDWIYIDRLIENDLRIEMYNMLGKKIMDQQLTDDKINIRHLPNGIYTLRLSGDTIKIVRVEVIH